MEQMEQIITQIRSRKRRFVPKRVWLPKDKLTGRALKALFTELCSLYHYRITGEDNFEIKFTDSYKRKLQIILRLLTDERATRGLYLFGRYGTGKTMTLWAMAEMLKIFNQGFEYSLLTANQIINIYREANDFKDLTEFNKLKYKPLLIIDDLGSEYTGVVQHFGNRVKPIENIIEMRYKTGRWTWATSNYSLVQLSEKYSGFIIDRLRQMMLFIEFDWESFRY